MTVIEVEGAAFPGYNEAATATASPPWPDVLSGWSSDETGISDSSSLHRIRGDSYRSASAVARATSCARINTALVACSGVPSARITSAGIASSCARSACGSGRGSTTGRIGL
jgi:hypothetical protein